MYGAGVLRIAVLTVAALLCAGPWSVARADHPLARLELGLATGLYRLQAGQDLGDSAQLVELRKGTLGTLFATFDLRADYYVARWFSLGALVSLAPGRLGERAALLVGYRGEALLHLPWRHPVVPFAGATGGGMSLLSPASVLGRDTDPAVGWTVGLKVRLAPRWRLRFDVTQLFTDAQVTGSVAQNLSFTVGVGLLVRAPALPPPPSADPLDADGDGLVDALDRCPHAAEDPDGFQDHDGCPDPDDDRDGLPDGDDDCPNAAGPRPSGCPPPRAAPGAPGASTSPPARGRAP